MVGADPAATLIVVLDTSTINLALPKAQAALGMRDATRGWVVTAYTLTFGGLLLLDGRSSSSVSTPTGSKTRRYLVMGRCGTPPPRCTLASGHPRPR